MSAFSNTFLNSSYLDKIFAPNPSTTRGAGIHIAMHPTLPLLIYTSGKFVIVKNYLNPVECFVYRGHSQPTTVAKFSPNGFWVASADVSGKLRIWSWDNPEHILKLEVPVFAGPIFDIDWDCESKKIAVVGEGNPFFVRCVQWDTGNSVGEMHGHIKRVLTCSYKSSRPFRIFSGGEDSRTIFYAGPPFKNDHSNNDAHTNFVNCIRYSASGDKAVSVSTDKKIVVYDGATGNPVGQVPNAHEGGIYSVSWSPDGVYFATASADKKIKIWNAETLACEQTITPSADPQLGDMQVSIFWAKDNSIISVSLNGSINVFSRDCTTSPNRVIAGHQVAVLALSFDAANQMLYTGSYDGVVIARNMGDFEGRKLVGGDKKHICNAAHNGKIVSLQVVGDNLVSVGWDDKLRIASIASNSYHTEVALDGQPIALAKSPASDIMVVATTKELAVFRGGSKLGAKSFASVEWTITCLAMPNDDEVAVGGSDNKTHIFNLSNFAFQEVKTIETRSAVSALAYSPSGEYLAVGDNGRQVEVFERGTWNAKVRNQWVNHTSKITTLSWSPNGERLASGSLDEAIYFWNLGNLKDIQSIPFTHLGGVYEIAWTSDETLVSVGADHTTVTWKAPPPK